MLSIINYFIYSAYYKKLKGISKNSMFIDGKGIFTSVKTKISQTAYPSVKDFATNDRKQIESDWGNEFLEVPLI